MNFFRNLRTRKNKKKFVEMDATEIISEENLTDTINKKMSLEHLHRELDKRRIQHSSRIPGLKENEKIEFVFKHKNAPNKYAENEKVSKKTIDQPFTLLHLKGIPDMMINEEITLEINKQGILLNEQMIIPWTRIKKAQNDYRIKNRVQFGVLCIMYVNLKGKSVTAEFRFKDSPFYKKPIETLVKVINESSKWDKVTSPFEI